MKNRIFYGKNTPPNFIEDLHFNRDCPYVIRYKECPVIDVTPLHYSDALEILVGSNVSANVYMESKNYQLAGNFVMVIPPKAVHSVTVFPSNGHVYVIHVSFEQLSPFVNIEALVTSENGRLDDLTGICPSYDEIYQCVKKIIANDQYPFSRICALANLISIIWENKRHAFDKNPIPNHSNNEQLEQLIQWTTQNYMFDISNKDAAAAVGFSENYFCNWFKKMTGLTYNYYLSEVRLSTACRLLLKTQSVSDACYGSGFSDCAYFIQLFKKRRGCTPKQYILKAE